MFHPYLLTILPNLNMIKNHQEFKSSLPIEALLKIIRVIAFV